MSTSRLEKFIYAICSMEVSDLPAPLSRIEILWNCLITGETPDFEPQSRNEQYLMAMLGLYELENLPTPMSRGEKLLYKIAMGETDLSDIPAYLSRYEELLGYLAENGGVGNFEYILQTLNQRLSTLYSTKERPMKQAVIKGDTLVNELPRPSLKNTMENVSSQKLNAGYDNGNVVDGEFKSAILKGNTLVNVYDYTSSTFIGEATIENGVITLKANGGWVVINNNKLPMLKPNTNYTIFVNILSNTLNYSNTELDYALRVEGDTGNSGFITGFDIPKGSVGIFKKLLTTKESLSTTTNLSDVRVHANANGGEIKFTYMIIEGDHTQEDIPYFTGIQSVQLSEVTTTGKNLFDGKLKHGEIAGGVDNTETKYVKSVNYISIEPNTYYSLTCSDGYNSTNGRVIAWYDSNKNFISHVNHYGVSPSNAYFARIRTRKDDSTAISKAELSTIQAQLEKGKVATPYEPYKSNTLTLAEPVTLRKVGEIQDEFDALTGQVTERVGEIVFNGSERWSESGFVSTNHYCAYTRLSKSKNIMSLDVICDSLPTKDISSSSKDYEGCMINDTSSSDSPGNLVIKIAKSKLSSASTNGIKEYLSQNPITVQYQLATPTTKTINPTITDQDGATQTKLHSFNDGHLSVSSQGLLPSAVDYEVPTNNSYYLPDMLTLGAQYTARGSADCNATIDGKLLALGKNRTFTTPSSVTDKLMVLDTAVDDLMFIKGDQTAKDFGYFEGMKSVEVTGIQVTGKNLFDETKRVEGYIARNSTNEELAFDKKNTWTTPWIEAEPNTNYIISDGNRNRWQMKSTSGVITYKDEQMLTISNDIEYIRCYYCSSNYTASNVQVEQGSVATPYEPYKSTTLTLNEPVTLRKVGDVEDTLDGLTGEVTKRIGEIVLNGSEKWSLSSNNPTNTDLLRFTTKSALLNAKKVSSDSITHYLTDKFEKHIDWNNMECAWVHYSNGRVNVVIKKDKLTSLDAEGLQSWLSLNPITVQYQLETESTKIIDPTTVDQDGRPTKLKTFNDITYVEIKADNLIPSVDLEVATKINEALSTIGPQQLDISNTQNKLGQTVDEQTENTDATMMATTEIYEQTL